MGNEAIAYAAVAAGVGVVAGYPGTPSTEVLETVAKIRTNDIYVEWSENEKAALELAAGASYSGARSMVTMKQVGLNVASDPAMSLSYVGVKGGLVIVVADDPGPISSQTEQDTRTFAAFSKMPVLDPESPEEAYAMTLAAFELSEKLGSPVILRPTTRVCHSTAAVDTDFDPKTLEGRKTPPETGFIKDPRWVIFPALSNRRHGEIEIRNADMRKGKSPFAIYSPGEGELGIAAGGISSAYMKEALKEVLKERRLPFFKVGNPFPFPEEDALEFLSGLKEVLVYEELDPVIERELTYICGKYHLPVNIRGKLTGDVPSAGENSADAAKLILAKFLGEELPEEISLPKGAPALPIRPPVLCAGCPHRASFYAVKRAMKGRKCHFTGDIGCYTLGNAQPLDMTDTCLCMGAGITIAQGLYRAEPDSLNFAFIGDSTFFASGLTGVANAVYNRAELIVVVLDNSTTAMTGHQPHPGTGKIMLAEREAGLLGQKLVIEDALRGLGVQTIIKCDPLDAKAAEKAVLEAADAKGVRAIIFESPCAVLLKPERIFKVDDERCVGCKKCINELGCPALIWKDGKAQTDKKLCTGCGLCASVCPTNAIGGEKNA
ncbi:MAG: indolepyruvate ferredoxin oxidoreductase subunit alpha [Firmicutes bacterium]|nr:indolepyruvate ferredoxin oxidoreductase subunit alpha [Bacillota bacterium]